MEMRHRFEPNFLDHFVCVCERACVCACTCGHSAYRGQKRASDPLELELELELQVVVRSLTQVLGTELRSSTSMSHTSCVHRKV